MAKPTYSETSFTAVLKKPVDLVAKLFEESSQIPAGQPVPLLAESPQRYGAARSLLWSGVISLVILIGFSLAAASSQAVDWSWGVGSFFTAGTLIGFGLGVNKYYSFGGIQGLGMTVFQSGANLVALEETWWFQATEKLRCIFNTQVINSRWLVRSCQTKPDGQEAVPVDLVFVGAMTPAADDLVVAWLRSMAADAMQSGRDSSKILAERLKAMADQIREILSNVLKPYTREKTYSGLRQDGHVFSESQAAVVATAINRGLAELGLPVRFAANPKVVDIIPPPQVAEQEEREAARLLQERRLVAEQEEREAARLLQERRLVAEQEKRAAAHAGKVAERIDDWGVELAALLALSDPKSEHAEQVAKLIERQRKAPDRLEAALLVRRLATSQPKALSAPNPNNGAASDGRDPGVQAQIEGLIEKLEAVPAQA